MHSSNKQLIIISAGGTGGHIYPAQAVAEALSINYALELITDTRGEKFLSGILKNVPKNKIIASSLKNSAARTFSTAIFSLYESAKLAYFFAKKKPKLVIGFGGYASLATLAAAALMRIPILIHEQNAVMGRVNRLFSHFAKHIATSFPITSGIPKKQLAKVVHTGLPLRAQINASLLQTASHQETAFSEQSLSTNQIIDQSAAQQDDISNTNFSILVIGGSQGTAIFSEIIPKAIEALPPKVQKLIHITQQARPNLVQTTMEAYHKTLASAIVQDFFYDISMLIASHDLVIARAGASTIFELIEYAKPAILVPFKNAKDNHQYHNAMFIASNQGAIILSESECTHNQLSLMLNNLFHNRTMLSSMQNQVSKLKTKSAAEKIVELVLKITSKPAGHSL